MALTDLTVSNPTVVGLPTSALALPGDAPYAPSPAGLRQTREAIAGYYADLGAHVDPERVVVTASTSEAYAFLWKLLCDAGDRVLVPRPSYPLFDFLLRLDCAEPVPFQAYDAGAIERALEVDSRIRALILVHPNNPTGQYVEAPFADRVTRLVDEHALALVVDEVFFDFPHAPSLPATTAGTFAGRTRHRGLTFTLSGLSKVCGLPGHKLGWIVVGGADDVATEALARLELIADTYLSVSTPVQHAAPRLLADRHGFQNACRERLRANLATLDSLGLPRRADSGGWTAVVPLAEDLDDECIAVDLLEEDAVVTHAGYLFDIGEFGAAGTSREEDWRSTLVLSLLTPERTFAEGVARIAARKLLHHVRGKNFPQVP